MALGISGSLGGIKRFAIGWSGSLGGVHSVKSLPIKSKEWIISLYKKIRQ